MYNDSIKLSVEPLHSNLVQKGESIESQRVYASIKKNAILESNIMKIFPNSIYEHYKGHHYRVIAIATYSEDINEQFVIYEALYPNAVSQKYGHDRYRSFLNRLKLMARCCLVLSILNALRKSTTQQYFLVAFLTWKIIPSQFCNFVLK